MRINKFLHCSPSSIVRIGGGVLEFAVAAFLVSLLYFHGVRNVGAATAPAVAAAAAQPARTPAASVCITDSRSGDFITFTNPGGSYMFTHCATSLMISGTGLITTPSGLITLTDNKPSQHVSASFNRGQLTGHAVVNVSVAQGVSQTFTINQIIPNAPCGACPK